MKKLGFNIVLLGTIASGKETQANILKKKYALKFVETGVYTRNLIKEKSKDGDLARRTAGKGAPLATALIKKFLTKEISNKPKNKNLLFLGGRLKPEAQLLKKILDARKEDFLVFYITLPDKEVYKRSIKRKAGNMKAIYKIFDTKKIIGIRIKWHKDQVVGKTVKYYKDLNKIKIINGNQSILKVTKDILKEVEKYKKWREK